MENIIEIFNNEDKNIDLIEQTIEDKREDDKKNISDSNDNDYTIGKEIKILASHYKDVLLHRISTSVKRNSRGHLFNYSNLEDIGIGISDSIFLLNQSLKGKNLLITFTNNQAISSDEINHTVTVTMRFGITRYSCSGDFIETEVIETIVPICTPNEFLII